MNHRRCGLFLFLALLTVGLCGSVFQAFADNPNQQKRKAARQRVAPLVEERIKKDANYKTYVEAVSKRLNDINQMNKGKGKK